MEGDANGFTFRHALIREGRSLAARPRGREHKVEAPQSRAEDGGRRRFGGLWTGLAMLFGPVGLLYAIMLLRAAPPDRPQGASITASTIGLAIVCHAMWCMQPGRTHRVSRAYLWIAAGLGTLAMALAFTVWFVHLRQMPWGMIAPTMAGVIAGAVISRQYAMVLLLGVPALFIGAMLASGA